VRERERKGEKGRERERKGEKGRDLHSEPLLERRNGAFASHFENVVGVAAGPELKKLRGSVGQERRVRAREKLELQQQYKL
jgi:hypothetical protein